MALIVLATLAFVCSALAHFERYERLAAAFWLAATWITFASGSLALLSMWRAL